MRRAFPIAAVVLVAAFVAVPAGVQAKLVESKVTADVFGLIDRHATVTYHLAGQVGTEGLTFACMGGRRVVLVRVEHGGRKKRVASATTSFFGRFFVSLEKRLEAIPGHYYARVKPRTRRSRHGTLRCASDRTRAFLVQVPPSLSVPPVVQGG